MCLKFDPVEQKLKQTCSGTCKNKCGFKHDEDTGLTRSSSAGPKVVQIEKGASGTNQYQTSPFLKN